MSSGGTSRPPIAYTPNASGIFVPSTPISHRDEEYDQVGFDVLWEMQLRHFWYRGRHRFLRYALKTALRERGDGASVVRAIDLGGGCGGWVKYLATREPQLFSELALADSSLAALERARTLLNPGTARYQIDLLNLGWSERWDVAFLLDVLEHLPNDVDAIREVSVAMKPGGLVFVTMPALDFFWSYNDEIVHHQRRYNRARLQRVGDAVGLRLVTARYFMFFLSPLLWLSRFKRSIADLSSKQKADLLARSHRVPPALVNAALSFVFSAETPLGHWVGFPWGTSILGVFEKPAARR
jgi:SAM-dependent methyltransferase